MRIIVNDDIDIFMHLLVKTDRYPNVTEEAIRDYVRSYRHSGLTDLFLNTYCQYSATPSAVVSTLADRYHTDTVDGLPLKKEAPWFLASRHVIEECGIDYFGVMFDECHKEGIRPWMSVRMNDVHCNILVTPTGDEVQSDYTHNARRAGIARTCYRDMIGYFDDALDYGKKEVRDRFLAYIREQLDRYDLCGVELDFMREPLCFRPGYEDEGRAILRGFLTEVRAITGAAAEKYGHPVEIAFRTYATPDSDFISGLDGLGLAREGLIDMLIPAPRWETYFSSVPLDLWRSLMPATCELAFSAEVNTRPCRRMTSTDRTEEEMNGLAAFAYGAGVDALYLFNDTYHFPLYGTRHAEAIRAFATEEDLMKSKRRHIVTYQDFTAAGASECEPLPKKFSYDYYTLHICTGKTNDVMYLLIDAGVEADALSVWLNAAPVEYLGKTKIEEALCSRPVLVYRTTSHRPLRQVLETHSSLPEAELCYVELRTEKPELL